MKNLVYVIILLLIASMVFNVYSLNFKISLLDDINRPYILGICAGICGLILSAIFLRFRILKARS